MRDLLTSPTLSHSGQLKADVLLHQRADPTASSGPSISSNKTLSRSVASGVPGGRDRPRREVGLMGGRDEREGSRTRAKRYLLGSVVLMFWPSFAFFCSTVASLGFSLSHPPASVLLSRANRGSFLSLRCCSLLGPC